jgi:chromosome segregation ATPase
MSEKRRGRPPIAEGAKSRTDIQRDYRARLKAAGKVLRFVDTWTTMTPAEIAELRQRLDNALLKLELREQDVARLDQRVAYLEGELRRVEQHHTNALKEIITLKQTAAAPSVRARPRAKSRAT